MKRRLESAERERQRWRKQRGRAPKYKPNYQWMRAYEEAIILADIERHPAEWVSCRDLRMQAPGRYSVKLLPVMQRMAAYHGKHGKLEVKSGRASGHIVPTFRKRTNVVRRAA